MKCLNRVVLIGYVSEDPSVKISKKGTKYGNFHLVTNMRWSDNAGNSKTSTEWHKVSFFGNLADYCQESVKMGSPVYVEGSIKKNVWQDKQGGESKEFVINASNIVVLGDQNLMVGEEERTAVINNQPQKASLINREDATVWPSPVFENPPGRIVQDNKKISELKEKKWKEEVEVDDKLRENLIQSHRPDFDDSEIPF